MSLLADFHFLRPAWLLLLVPALLLVLWVWRRQSAELAWGRIMAPHLLEHLLVTALQAKKDEGQAGLPQLNQLVVALAQDIAAAGITRHLLQVGKS